MITAHAGESAARTRVVQQAIDFIKGSHGMDNATAEKLLLVLAARSGSSPEAVAEDLVSGRPFRGRPSWL